MTDVDSRLPVKTDDLVLGVDYNLIEYTYPSPAVEVILYKLLAVLIRTVTITYVSSSKKDVLTVSVT